MHNSERKPTLTITVSSDSHDSHRIEFNLSDWQYVLLVCKRDFADCSHPRHFLKDIIGRGIYSIPDEVFEKFCEALQGD
jgi:hypothetical protein